MRLFIDINFFVYLNVNIDDEFVERFDCFYVELVRENEVYMNVFVLDEFIYVFKWKYGVSYFEMILFIEDVVLFVVRVFFIIFEDYFMVKEIIFKYYFCFLDVFYVVMI